MLSINRRLEGKDEGYQRVLSNARVAAVANHIRSGHPIPKQISQHHLRMLLDRIGRIAVKQGQQERSFFAALQRYTKSSHKTPRNNVLYSSVWWEWPDDLDLSTKSQKDKAALCDHPSEGYEKFMIFLDALEALNCSLLHSLAGQVQFNSASLHALAQGTGGRALVA